MIPSVLGLSFYRLLNLQVNGKKIGKNRNPKNPMIISTKIAKVKL
jgi:hypothetical protein